ncbi:hypothetical protein TWF281_001587 [Arthrobotrys megalospora]
MWLLFFICATLSCIPQSHAVIVLHMMWGWHNETKASATEVDKNRPDIPTSAPLELAAGELKGRLCHSSYEKRLNYYEICTPYSAKLCEGHDAWDNYLLNEVANYVWIRDHKLSHEDFNEKWPLNYDYTFEFFSEDHCITPMLDDQGGPVQFTIDTAWQNDENVRKVAAYLQRAKMPVSGYWRGSRKEKGEAKLEFGHHTQTCNDPAHCTPPPHDPKL